MIMPTKKDSVSEQNPLKPRSQLEKVMIHLLQQKYITQNEATKLYNCARLSSIIHRLRKVGVRIDSMRRQDNINYYVLQETKKIRNYLYLIRINRIQKLSREAKKQ